MTHALTFPAGFVWGSATSAYQVEGGTGADGRVPSIWDTFTALPGAISDASSGAVAADHYHRWRDDVALMSSLGINAYRFSIAWPRMQPERGQWNAPGKDFYSQLVDALLDAGITPWVTLYHWDLPQWIEDRGGWPERSTADLFREYVSGVAALLGDRVERWITVNEPWCSAFAGYAGGQHAPGRCEPQAGVDAAHHLLLAHGMAVQTLRAADRTPPGHASEVGITLSSALTYPADPAAASDQEAAIRFRAVMDGVFLSPLLRREYPQVLLDAYDARGLQLPVRDSDMETIATPIDFLGVNYYHTETVTRAAQPGDAPGGDGQAGATAPALAETGGSSRPVRNPCVGAEDITTVSRGLPRTATGWEVDPGGLRDLLVDLQENWTGPAGISVYVTENGAAFDDEQAPTAVPATTHGATTHGATTHDGQQDPVIVDDDRTRFVLDHVRALHGAMTDGVDVRGYFLWSLLDNFEWAAGYGPQFGIVDVAPDLSRRLKASAIAYSGIARTGQVPASEVRQADR